MRLSPANERVALYALLAMWCVPLWLQRHNSSEPVHRCTVKQQRRRAINHATTRLRILPLTKMTFLTALPSMSLATLGTACE